MDITRREAMMAAAVVPVAAGLGVKATGWQNHETLLVSDLYLANSLFFDIFGDGLRHVHIGSDVWWHVVCNGQVHKMSGKRVPPNMAATEQGNDHASAILSAAPWIVFHVYETEQVSLFACDNAVIAMDVYADDFERELRRAITSPLMVS